MAILRQALVVDAAQDLLGDHGVERLAYLALGLADSGDRRRREGHPDHRGVLHQVRSAGPRLSRRAAARACKVSGTSRSAIVPAHSGSPPASAVPVQQHADDLDAVKRHTFGPLQDPLDQVLRQPGHETVEQRLHLTLSERAQVRDGTP